MRTRTHGYYYLVLDCGVYRTYRFVAWDADTMGVEMSEHAIPWHCPLSMAPTAAPLFAVTGFPEEEIESHQIFGDGPGGTRQNNGRDEAVGGRATQHR